MGVQWPWVLYTLLAGMGAGVFAGVALSEWTGRGVRMRLPGAIVAAIAVFAGGIADVLYFGHPERLFNLLGNLGSNFAQSMLLTALTTIVAIVYIVMLRRGDPASTRRTVATAGLVCAILLAIVLGGSPYAAFGNTGNAWLVPVFYLVSAAVLGLFTLMIVNLVIGEEPALLARIDRAMLIALAVEALVVILYGALLMTTAAPLKSLARIATGDLALAFWGGVVAAGLVIPLGVAALLRQERQERTLRIAEASIGWIAVVAGGLVTRALLFLLSSNVMKF